MTPSQTVTLNAAGIPAEHSNFNETTPEGLTLKAVYIAAYIADAHENMLIRALRAARADIEDSADRLRRGVQHVRIDLNDADLRLLTGELKAARVALDNAITLYKAVAALNGKHIGPCPTWCTTDHDERPEEPGHEGDLFGLDRADLTVYPYLEKDGRRTVRLFTAEPPNPDDLTEGQWDQIQTCIARALGTLAADKK